VKKLMCVPNVSEGRDQEKVQRFVDSITRHPGVKLVDLSSDKDHNRSVYSYLGDPESVLAATMALAELVFESVDMSSHTGSHPRMGALDVVPFIPVGSTTTEEAVGIARRFGKFVGEKGIPVYYYEDAATSPQRTSLVDVRKGEYEGLEAKLTDPAWAPDEGPAVFSPATGSVQVAARFPLVAFNVNLRTDDVEIAKRIAKAVRHRDGGYRYVRGMGLALEGTGMVQVSMNLTNYEGTPIPRVLETIRAEAARHGVAVAGAELVGPVPVRALEEVVRQYLQVHDFSVEQIIEMSM
jgi:glutamate formiminotransferase